MKSWTIFKISFISLLETIKVVVLETCIFYWIPVSIAERAVVVPNGTKIIFSFANENASFINGTAILLNNEPRTPPD